MRAGDPVCTSITTIRRILQQMNLDSGPNELVHHHPPPNLDPIPQSYFQPQTATGPSVWEQQQETPLQPTEEPGLASDTDLQFDLDFSSADFNVDITAIDWGTFFTYSPM